MTGLIPALLLEILALVPEHAVVPLPREQVSFEVLVRNVSEISIPELRFRMVSESCEARLVPDVVGVLEPSDEISLKVRLRRNVRTGADRFPVHLEMTSPIFPDIEPYRLLVDANPNARPAQAGLLEVGAIKVEERAGQSRRWVLFLVCSIPLAGLWGLGALWKRRGRDRAVNPQPNQPSRR